MKHSKAFQNLEPYLKNIRSLRYESSVLYYDLATSCPMKSLSKEGALINGIDEKTARIYADPAFVNAVEKLGAEKESVPEEKRLYESLSYNIRLLKKMSVDDYVKAKKAFTQSNEMWRRYKPKADFESWLPYWKECIRWARIIDKNMMTPDMTNPYDAALDIYEPGERAAWLDQIFAPLKKAILALLPSTIQREKEKGKPTLSSYSVDAQRCLSLALLKTIGYDMDGGCIRESLHPFSTDIAQYDARITTKYLVDDWRSNAFSVIHEGGHSLEFQNKPQEMYDSYLESVATAAICETHSRLYENIIGRSREFVPLFKKDCEEALGTEFKSLSDEDFYRLINWVEPGLNRCESDELTYSLHIIIRYEIERDLINGVIECEDVPALWNKKYQDYLGVKVPNNAEGCMQDIHWTDNEIGYFPSYALGNLYGAMIFDKMDHDIQARSLIKEGKMNAILDWLRQNDYRYDWMDPKDWIKAVTGKDLSSQSYIAYLTNKYR